MVIASLFGRRSIDRRIDERDSFASTARRNRATSGHQQKPRTVVGPLFGLDAREIAPKTRLQFLHNTASRQIGFYQNVQLQGLSHSGQRKYIALMVSVEEKILPSSLSNEHQSVLSLFDDSVSHAYSFKEWTILIHCQIQLLLVASRL